MVPTAFTTWFACDSCDRVENFLLRRKSRRTHFFSLAMTAVGSVAFCVRSYAVCVLAIPACHAGDRGSIPRRGAMCYAVTSLM